METFTGLKALTDNPDFQSQRQRALAGLDTKVIDSPILDVITNFARLDCCFTLQSCYGHFLYEGQNDSHNIASLPVTDTIIKVEYRIAYIALVIDNSNSGKTLFNDLMKVPQLDPEYIQIGCADWFWKKHVNSYALQIEPDKQMYQDRAWVSYSEALHLENIRIIFFDELRKLLKAHLAN